MKGQNNDIPFIKNSFGEDDYLKVNNIKNNILQKNDQNSTQDLSLTVHMDENENNIIMNEKEIKYVIGPLFPLLFILDLSSNIFLQIFVFKNIPSIFKTIGSILNILQIYFFIITSSKNPGLPNKEYEKLIYEEKNKTAKNFRKCKDCKLWINTDEKTIHCKKCDICIEGYDHHCDCINICVGKKNIKNFYFLILISFLIIIYSIFIYMGFK